MRPGSPLQDWPGYILHNGQQREYEPINQEVRVVLAGIRLYGDDAAIGWEDQAEEEAATSRKRLIIRLARPTLASDNDLAQ